MRLSAVLWYAAVTLLLNAGFLLLSGLVSVLYADRALFPLLYSALIAALFGFFILVFLPRSIDITPKEGLAIVVSSWLVSCMVGVLPYVLWGGEFTVTNAWFESVSGYTTTGSSILNEIEALPRGLLFWRSATHFIGGIGIIVFALAVLPALQVSGLILYNAESSEWSPRDFHHSARRSVEVLFKIYVSLTVLEASMLLVCGMDLFDAITTSFGTIATGGFSPRQASIAAYNSVAVEITVIVFMFLAGIHFGLLFLAVRGNVKGILTSSPVRYYGAALVVGCVVVAASVCGGNPENPFDWIRHAVFQVVSIGTSTGFATADSSSWPALARLILIFLTFLCACAGSTSGGIKVDRMVVFLKAVVRRLRELHHPKAVIPIRMSGATVEENVALASVAYIALYVCIVFLSACVLAGTGVDALSAFTGSAATMGNVGPGLGSVGSTSTFAHIPTVGKWVLSFTMLLGRLEIYGVLIFLTPGMWRR